jgi:hypothetical protein
LVTGQRAGPVGHRVGILAGPIVGKLVGGGAEVLAAKFGKHAAGQA